MGREEIDVIEPVVSALRSEGMHLDRAASCGYALVPQRLPTAMPRLRCITTRDSPVLKYASFGEGVNITLGLPIIRTSVDHGTAVDIAGTGNIDSGSMKSAIELAIVLAAKQAARATA